MIGLIIGTSGCATATCYIPLPPQSPQVKMRYEYKELLDKYYKDGTINQETYDKLIKAFEDEMKDKK